MAELIAAIIFFGSFIGMVVIVWRKFPVLLEFPEDQSVTQENFLVRLKNGIINTPAVKNFSLTSFLQKILSRIRILVMKLENKTSNLLQKLREKSKKEKNNLPG